jgi:chitinase
MVSANPTLDHGPEDNPVGVEDLYRRVLALRSSNSALKVLLSVGGGKSTSKVFSDMVANSGNRKIFLDSAMEIIKKYEFDGIDIKWELPEDPRDKVNFSNLLKELRAALNAFEPPLMLTAALGGGVERMANVYDLKTIAGHVHYMSIMAYDYKMYGEDSTQIEHHSPLSHPNESADSVNSTIQYILKDENVGPEFADKVVMGVAAYGRTYTMSDKGQHSIGSNATGPGDKYPYSNEPGVVMYFEMCINLVGKTDWEFEFEDGYNVPYAHNDSQWIGYDNEYSIMAKVDLAKGLGGMMLWSLDMDDAKGKCGGWYDNPLANAIKNQLRYISNEETRK